MSLRREDLEEDAWSSEDLKPNSGPPGDMSHTHSFSGAPEPGLIPTT